MSGRNELFIGIDAGTTVVKAVLFDAEGNEKALAQKSVPADSLLPGYQEMDMYKVWEAAKETIKSIVHKSEENSRNIKAIGITGQGVGAWLIDEAGEPVRKAILWSDERAAGIVNEWVENGAAGEIYELCGSAQFSGCQGPIIKWLDINERETLKKAKHALYCKDWIKFKLTGRISTEASDASISFLNVSNWSYDLRIIKLMEIENYSYLFPPVQPFSEPTGKLLSEIAAELGLPEGVEVVAASFDTSACALGVGAINDGDACSILGTALVNEIIMDSPETEPLNVGFTLAHVSDKKRWLRMLNPNLGTPNLDWFLRNFCSEDYVKAEALDTDIFSYLQDKIRAIPIGADGVLYTPFLSAIGVRMPFLDENTKAQFIGLSPSHSRHHALRALFEGIALAIRHCYENLPRKIEKLNLSGGGSRSRLWCQIISDTLNTVVRVPSGSEFGAKGAALNAAVAVGYFDSYEDAVKKFVKFEREYKPNYENHLKYDRLYQIYNRIFANMSDTWRAIADFKKESA